VKKIRIKEPLGFMIEPAWLFDFSQKIEYQGYVPVHWVVDFIDNREIYIYEKGVFDN
jgi:hypothetical protein